MISIPNLVCDKIVWKIESVRNEKRIFTKEYTEMCTTIQEATKHLERQEKDDSEEGEGHTKMHVNQAGINKNSAVERCNKHGQLQEATAILRTRHNNEQEYRVRKIPQTSQEGSYNKVKKRDYQSPPQLTCAEISN